MTTHMIAQIRVLPEHPVKSLSKLAGQECKAVPQLGVSVGVNAICGVPNIGVPAGPHCGRFPGVCTILII